MDSNINQSNTQEAVSGLEVSINNSKSKLIKCGNCGYEGPGEKARSKLGIILAWIGFFISWFITAAYFLFTHAYRCPKCKSTFVGVKNKKGELVSQQRNIVVVIIVLILTLFLSIAVIGIFSSVVLASLNSARIKGADAAVKSYSFTVKARGLLYQEDNGTYKGFCNNKEVIDILQKMSIAAIQNMSGYVCNDSDKEWAVSSPLKSGGYWCVDSSENKPNGVAKSIGTNTSCVGLPNYSKDDKAIQTTNGTMTKEVVIKQMVSAIKTKVSLPVKLNDSITLLDISAEPTAIHYFYEIVGLTENKITESELKNLAVLSNCGDENLKKIIISGIDANITYTDSSTKNSSMVNVTSKDCSN